MLDLIEKRKRLLVIYASFEAESAPFRSGAACEPGCADCCTDVGDVDMTTLEGVFVQDAVRRLAPAFQKELKRRIKENRKVKGQSRFARCAFLLSENLCAIYSSRPFSCRRLYSMKRCGETGPMVHRRLWILGDQAVDLLRELDDTGCSGHMSYVLSLLNDSRFHNSYLNGDFAPDEARELIRGYGLTINRYARSLNAARQNPL